jgi:uncharacterized protein YoxC
LNKKNEIEIESIETPKGKVPTVKGLENALNHVIDQTMPIVGVINTFAEDISNMKNELNNISSAFQSFGDNFAELIILLGKLDKKITIALEQLKEGKIESIKEQQDLLVELQTILTKTLMQFQELPLQLKVNPD